MAVDDKFIPWVTGTSAIPGITLEGAGVVSPRARSLVTARNLTLGGGKSDPYKGLNAFVVRITDDYRTFAFYGDTDYKIGRNGTAWSRGERFRSTLILSDIASPITIKWGDGTENVYTYADVGYASHTYGANGDYTVTMTDNATTFSFYGNTHIISVENLAPKTNLANIYWAGDTSSWSFYFAGCTNLEFVNIGETSSNYIRNWFGGSGRYDGLCDRLESVVIGRNITTLGDRSFYSLGAWKGGIDVPSNVTRIGADTSDYNIFRDTPFAYVRLPETLESINGMYHFYQRSYPVVIDATTPPTVARSEAIASFRGKFYVPDESVELYRSAQYWSSYASSILPVSQWVKPQ